MAFFKSFLYCCFSDLVTICFLRGGVVGPTPNPQPGGPGLRIYVPQRHGGPAIPPHALGFPFSHLLQHTGVRWGYSSPPPHGE
jgi:hypothetical protein